MTWYNSFWDKRKAITLTGGSDGAQTDYQIKLDITYDSEMNVDFSDIRFTAADGTTLLDAWLQEKVDSNSAVVWVETDTPANAVDADIYMYYGNSIAASDWDIDSTFVFADDFPGTAIDTVKWDTSGTPTVASGEASLNDDDIICGKTAVGLNHAIEASAKADEQDSKFVSLQTGIGDGANQLAIINNDSAYPNDFDRFQLQSYKASVGSYPYIDGWTDFRTDFEIYRIIRNSSSLTTYEQGSNSTTGNTNVPITDLNAYFNTWDSTQESILTIDWIFIRKHVDGAATTSMGAEEDPNWNDIDWTERQRIVLTGGSDGAQTDYQIKLTIPFKTGMQADFDDLRFVNLDKTLILNAWLESKVDSDEAIVWVNFPITPADGETLDYYMYYNNSAISSFWDIDATFEFADDFPGTSVDTVKWNTLGAPTVASGEVILDADDGIESNETFGIGYAVESSSKADEQDTTLLGFREPVNYNNDIVMYNSDSSYPDDFTRFAFHTENTGTPTSTYQTGWTDFRTDFEIYRVIRNSSSLVTFEQGANSTSHTTNIPTIDLSVAMDVWDSSQASTLTCEWLFVRKNVDNPATYDIEDITSWAIRINGQYYTDFMSINVLDTVAGSKTFKAVFSSAEKDTVFNHFDDVEIYGEDGTLIYRGRTEEIKPDYTMGSTIVSGKDYLSELIDKYVVEGYTDKLRSYIVDDIVSKNSAHLTRNNVQVSPVGTELSYTFKSSVWDTLIQCAGDDDYRFWVDVDNDLHYGPKGYTDSGMTLIVGTDNIMAFEIDERGNDIINRVTFYGSGTPQVVVMVEDIASQEYYGVVKEKRIIDDQVVTEDLAEAKANAYLAENAWVLDMITFTAVGYEKLNAGELIHATIDTHNIDSDYLVISKQHNSAEGTTTIKVARYEKNTASIINGLVGRMLNIEQSFMDETATMVRIQQFYEDIMIKAEYEIYQVDFNDTFRLGHDGYSNLGKTGLGSKRTVALIRSGQ